jgi:succinate dehydrogenase hydrophobic anchor subunit
VIHGAGTAAFILRRASGAALSIYFFVWLARLERSPLVPFGGDLGRTGSLPLKLLEIMVIALLAAHAFEGLSQVLVQRLRLRRWRAALLLCALLLAASVGLQHLPWFVAGVAPP